MTVILEGWGLVAAVIVALVFILTLGGAFR